jgi:hypothetical protein
MIQGLVLRLLGPLGQQASSAQEVAGEAEGEAGAGDDEPAPWSSALTVFNLAQAILAQARLQDEGIPARLRQEAVNYALPLTVGIIGRIDVMVPEPMLEKALSILDATAP